MSEVREIVTRAVLAKGRKNIKVCETIPLEQQPYSVLGCWVINHEFEVVQDQKQVNLTGSFEIDIWYAYDNNTKTDIARTTTKYQTVIKVKDIVCDATTDHTDVIVRILQQPTCTNACIKENAIEVEVVFDALAEIIGETKMMVNVYSCNDNIDPIDNLENEINEDFIPEN